MSIFPFGLVLYILRTDGQKLQNKDVIHKMLSFSVNFFQKLWLSSQNVNFILNLKM